MKRFEESYNHLQALSILILKVQFLWISAICRWEISWFAANAKQLLRLFSRLHVNYSDSNCEKKTAKERAPKTYQLPQFVTEDPKS